MTDITEADEALMQKHNKLFDGFFSGAITEQQFHARLKRTFGYDQGSVDEMRELWLGVRLRKQKAPLFARATEILNTLPLEQRRELRDVLLDCIAELPVRLGWMAVFDVFVESAGGILPDGSFTPPSS